MGSLLFIAVLLFQTTGSVVKAEVPFLNESMVEEHTTYFYISDSRFEGANILTSELQSAHFVALGELHNRVRLGELTRALLTYLEPHGFSHFAVETGPFSAYKLEQLIQTGKSPISEFYDGYSSGLFDFVPIPFFTGESDLNFLAAADSLGYELWGLDQEFAFSYTYLIDELAELAGDSLSDEQKQLRRKLNSRLYWLNRRKRIFSSFERSCRLKNDEQLQKYLRSFEQSGHPLIQQIIHEFETTLEIYCLAEQGKASSRVRVRNFKENFNAYYREASGEHQEPKVFLKIGSFHAGRQQSPLGIYDIGNHIQILADTLSQKSVHIRYLNRFYNGDDMLEEKGWESSSTFISVGRQDKWALIDLRPLRKRIEEGTLQGTEFETREIINYDFIIIPPEDDMVKKHF
ncbi:MAG: hypothetical protein GVY20_01180 [Bacteroidetes bacterium]|jgi:hypothetical protein|nr:hypothetical protein [Bacteroidota bacterium]